MNKLLFSILGIVLVFVLTLVFVNQYNTRNFAQTSFLEIEKKYSYKMADPLVNQINHFAEVVSKKTKPKVNGNDGLISLKIFAAIKKSAKTGKKVKI